MKKFAAIMASLTMLLAVGCDKNDDGGTPPPPMPDGTYVGTLSVDEDGAPYTQDKVSIVLDIDNGTASIKMLKVKFSPNMPVTLDMTIPGITVQTEGKDITLSGDGIVPEAMGGEFPMYTITGLRGTVTGDGISFSMKCGKYPTSFTGTKAE